MEENPNNCNHKYEFMQGGQGGPDPDHWYQISACKKCGEIKVQGRQNRESYTHLISIFNVEIAEKILQSAKWFQA
jgi:hypothetical protein